MEIHRTKSPPLNDLQAGGHGGDKSVVYEGRCIKKLTCESEIEWYKRLTDGSFSVSCLDVFPKFVGVERKTNESGKQLLYIILENIHYEMISFVVVIVIHDYHFI